MKKMHLKFCLICLFFLANPLFSKGFCADFDLFPVYPSIKPNVKFWTQVFTTYSTFEGIIHDSENLNIIYEVIELPEPGDSGKRKNNDNRIKRAKNKYKRILEKLASNPSPSDSQAKRIAALFGKNANSAAFRKARYKIRCQMGQKERFREGIIRSGAYIEQIKDVFRSYGLPEDLAYLPHVESSFHLKAYSKFGAAGIWQFVRNAGKQFMTVGYALDERWDPIRSSEAAAQLLKHSHEKFASWPLAITAYNHGIAGVLKAKWAKGDYESIFNDYKSRSFRFASRNFYSEFLAARNVAKNHEQYFGELELDKPLECREIVLAGYASVKDLSRYFGVDIATIRKLNPSLRPPVFREQKYVPKGYALKLPVPDEKPDLPKTVASRGKTGKRSQLTHVPPFGILPQAAPGKRKVSKQPAFTLEAKITTSQLSADPSVMTDNLQVKKIIKKRGKPVGIIQVEIEETLGHYGEWLEIPTRKIRRLNGFPYGRPLPLHKKVKIPLDKISKDQFEEIRFEYHKKIQEDFFSFYKVEAVQAYRVKKGDNIWALCNEAFEIPVWLIKKYNPTINFNDLRWSENLVIPVVRKLAANEMGDFNSVPTAVSDTPNGGIASDADILQPHSRGMIKACLEPFTNWTASLAKNIAIVGGLLTALVYPWLFIVLMIALILLITFSCQNFEVRSKKLVLRNPVIKFFRE